MSVKDTPEYQEVIELLGIYRYGADTSYYEIKVNPDKTAREVYPFRFKYVWRKRSKWHSVSVRRAKSEIDSWLSAGYIAELDSVKKAEHNLAKAQERRARAEQRANMARLHMMECTAQREAFDFMNWLGNGGKNTKELPRAWGIIGETGNE